MALALLKELQPNTETYNSAIAACRDAGRWPQAQHLSSRSYSHLKMSHVLHRHIMLHYVTLHLILYFI